TDAVDGDAELVELQAEGLGEPGDARLGGGVVGLTEVAHQPGAGGGVDHATGEGLAALGALTPVAGGVVAGGPGSLDVDPQDRVEVAFAHVPDGAVSHDAGVVHEHVELAEGVDGLGDHATGAVVV